LLVNNDVLSCGPLPPFRSLGEWQRVREAYLRTLDYPEEEPFSFASLPTRSSRSIVQDCWT